MFNSTEQVTRTAIVMAADGVRFVASGCDAAVGEQLAAYVRGRCDDTLWPNDSRRVRQLLDDGRVDDAIETYFAMVGQRWDTERLEVGQ